MKIKIEIEGSHDEAAVKNILSALAGYSVGLVQPGAAPGKEEPDPAAPKRRKVVTEPTPEVKREETPVTQEAPPTEAATTTEDGSEKISTETLEALRALSKQKALKSPDKVKALIREYADAPEGSTPTLSLITKAKAPAFAEELHKLPN